MGFFAWIVVGLIAGWLAKMIVPGREPTGFWATTAIGIVGAIIGGLIARAFGWGDLNGVHVWSIVLATLGAVILLFCYHAVVGTRTRA